MSIFYDTLSNKLLILYAGVAITIYAISVLTKMFSYKKVTAECIRNTCSPIVNLCSARKRYKSMFFFTYNGRCFAASESDYLGWDRTIGENYSILVNKDNPQQILSVSELIYHFFFLIFGIVLLIMPFYR